MAAPVKILGNVTGVVLGLLHFTLGFVVLLIFSVLQTIPRSLEEAAEVHGASAWRVFRRVVLPLSAPGVIVAGLVIFNLSMGAFTAVSLLGGGRILTLPVLIERTMILETKYAMAACLAAVLLGTGAADQRAGGVGAVAGAVCRERESRHERGEALVAGSTGGGDGAARRIARVPAPAALGGRRRVARAGRSALRVVSAVGAVAALVLSRCPFAIGRPSA